MYDKNIMFFILRTKQCRIEANGIAWSIVLGISDLIAFRASKTPKERVGIDAKNSLRDGVFELKYGKSLKCSSRTKRTVSPY